MPMVCYYLEVIKLLFFPTFMPTELGWVGERDGEIFVSKPLFFRLVSRKLFPAFLRPSCAYFFFLRRSLGVTSLLSIGFVGKSCNFLN